MSKYVIELDTVSKGVILNTENNKYVALIETKRPDLGFEELQSILDKVNNQHTQLDERQKKIIPKFAHEFIQEGIDSGADYFTIIICADSFANAKPQEKFSKWLRGNSDLFIQALLNGYEVEGTVEEVAEG